MSNRVILDVRSGDKNSSTTGLGLRVLREGDREGYEIGSEGVSGYMVFAQGDVDLSFTGGQIELDTYLEEVGGKHYYLTGVGHRAGLVLGAGESGRLLYGGSVYESDLPDVASVALEVDLGGLYWWSRNDRFRVRYEYAGGRFQLVSGGRGLLLGNVGDDELLSVGSLDGEVRLSGGAVYEVGSLDLPIGDDFGVVGRVSEEGVLEFIEGAVPLGESITWIGGSLSGSGELVYSGDYLSPIPMRFEEVLLRESGYGFSSVLYVETEAEFSASVDRGVVEVCRDTGRVNFSGGMGLRYEGLVLGSCGYEEYGSIDEVPVQSIPDGSGLEVVGEANGFAPNGSGLVWSYFEGERHWLLMDGGEVLGVEFVESLPKRLSVSTGYVVRGSREIHLASRWSGVSGKLVISSLPLVVGEGLSSYPVEGESEVSVVVAGGVEVVEADRFGFLEVAGEVSSPSDVAGLEQLKSLGLVPEGSGGLRVVMSTSSVVGFVRYEEESVGRVSGASAFQILVGLEPRRDMVGYGVGRYFKVGDKVLEEGVDLEFADLGFHWVKSYKSVLRVTEEVSRIGLVPGLRPQSTSLKVKTEGYDGSYLETEYVEGEGYDLPSEGLEGAYRLKRVLGGELLVSGGVGSVSLGGGVFDLGKDVEGVLKGGDWLFDGELYARIQSVSGREVVLDRELTAGSWKGYEGYREGVIGEETPDQTKLLGELFESHGVYERDPVEVYKVYGEVLFGKVSPTSRLYLRDIVSGERSELVVLRDAELDAPYRTDLQDAHISSGSYRVRVEGVEYEAGVAQSGKGFVLSGSLIEFQLNGVPDSSWVTSAILVKIPREGFAEYSLSTSSWESPYVEYEFLEQLSGVSYNGSSGTVSFAEPLDGGVGVEVSYTPTDTDGVRILESMAFTRTQEEASRLSGKEYAYNPAGVEVITEVTPTVYVGAEQIVGFSYTSQKLVLPFEVDASVSVRVNYASTEALGGEQVVKTSTSMMIPKFQLSEGSSVLSLSRDMTSVIYAGGLLKLGSHLFKVVSIDAESVELSPPARHGIEVERLEFLSIPESVYDDVSGRYALREVRGASVVSKPKSPDVYLQGDYKDMIFAKSVLVIQNIPYQVQTVEVDSQTGVTKVTLDGFTLGHEFTSASVGEVWVEGENDLSISFRPIFSEGELRLNLLTGVLSDEPYTLLKSGRELVEDRDYRLNAQAGVIELSRGVSSGETYHLFHTSLASISPRTMLGGRVSYPVVEAEYLASTPPTDYDGSSLLCSCWVYSPDSFQVSVMSDDDYAVILAEKLTQQSQSGRGVGGKQSTASSSLDGRGIGYYDTLADDVVTRARILLYHGYVSPVEDLISTSTGKVVGDTDGGFKFDLTQGRSRGQEDPLTREMRPRYVSMELLAPLNPANLYPTPEDTITIGGDPPELDVLNEVLEGQRDLIENEIDDYVLLTQKKSMSLSTSFPFIRYDYTPVYAQMWGQHRFSRLFPERTKMLTISVPGSLYGDRDGKSTNGLTIANVENPALGQIEGVTSLTLKKRASRFRVVDYSSNGFSEINASSSGKPTFLVSAVNYEDFPLTAEGLPDDTQFISEGGDIPDALSGNLELSFRGLSEGDYLALSREGVLYPIKETSLTSSLPDTFGLGALEAPVYAKVESVLSGCLVVLEGDASTLECNGETLALNPPRRGETLVQSFAKDLDDEDTPPSTYRVGADVGLRSATGEIIDISLPSLVDFNFPYKEIAEQNVPAPLTPLEGEVSFLYKSLDPFEYPALKGEEFNDAGDITIPYRTRFTERDLLPLVPPALEPLQKTTLNTVSGNQEYVYPDEVRDDTISTVAQGGWEVDRLDGYGQGVCEQVPRQGDLMVIVPDDSGSLGSASTGVSEIALVEGSVLYPPHFDCPTDGLYLSVPYFAVEIADDDARGMYASEVLELTGNDWTISKFTLGFSEFQIGQLVTKVIADNGILDLKINSPFTGTQSYLLRIDHSNGSLRLFSGVDEVSLALATNVSITNIQSSFIEITQDPIVDILTQAEGGVYPGGHETWAMRTGSANHFWQVFQNYSTNDVGTKTTTTDSHFDFVIDLLFPETFSDYIQTDRVRIHSDLAGWFFSNTTEQALLTAGGGVTPLDVTPSLAILSSWFNVSEDGGANTGTLQTDVNSNALLNSNFVYYEGTHYTIEDAQTFRFIPLWGVDREDDKVSLFIGSEVNETEVILSGTSHYGLMSQGVEGARGILRSIVPAHGALDNVIKCDLVYVEGGHSAGTYRVRGVLTQDETHTYQETLGTSFLLPVEFPSVVSFTVDGQTGTLETDVEDLTLYFPEGGGTFFILLTNDYLVAPTSNQHNTFDQTFGQSIVRVEYDSISGSSFVFTERLQNQDDNPTYFDGEQGQLPTGVTLAELTTLLGSGGQSIGGVTRLPIDIMATGLFDCPTPFNLEHTGVISLQLGGGTFELNGNLFVSNNLEKDDLGVITTLVLSQNDFPDIEDNQGNVYGVGFLTPSDVVELTINLPAGIYLDPATPKMRRDYRGTTPSVWGDGSTNTRSVMDYTISTEPAFDYYEEVNITVRRLRRYSDMFPNLISALEGFRYLYVQRQGLVNQITQEGSLVVLTPDRVNGSLEPFTGGTQTQVGDFLNVVSVGDQVRCFNALDQETLHFRVTLVGDTLKGQPISGRVGDAHVRFEVTTRIGIVPELQAFSQLLDHGFDVIHSTEAIDGITVSQDNTLSDTNLSFVDLGVQEGDFLVIDPQGQLPNSTEYGYPPRGDAPNGAFQDPHPLDDNRGAYLVKSVSETTLEVEFYAGTAGIERQGYSFLPPVSGNFDQPLRQTAGEVGGTYSTTTESIHPFSYRILRAKPTLGQEMAGTLLFYRERALSWVEIIERFNSLPVKPSTWLDFDEGELIYLMGENDPTHPSNDVLLSSILGEIENAPFTSTRLSVADRRVLIEDPTSPVLVEGMPTALENDMVSMSLRESRYLWIKRRVNKLDGTLQALSRVTLP